MKKASLAAITLALLVGLGSAQNMSIRAQEGEVIEPLDLNQPLVLDYNLVPAGPPTFENLTDGRRVFRLDAAGSASRDLEGTINGAITQAQIPGYEQITNTFSIETDEGSIKGYLVGTYHPVLDDNLDGTSTVRMHGQILSVTGVYADLFLAEVHTRSEVSISGGIGSEEIGTMTIMPRP